MVRIGRLALIHFTLVLAGCNAQGGEATDAKADASQRPLKIESPRLAWTNAGPNRTSRSYWPGENFVLAFGVTDDGRQVASGTKFKSGAQCIDANGKVISTHESSGVVGDVWRGKDVTLVGAITLPEDAAPGEHVVRWTVKNESDGREASVEEKIVIRPKDFAIFNPSFKSDRGSTSLAPLCGVVHGNLVGRVQVAEAARGKGGRASVDLRVDVVDDSDEVVQTYGPQTVKLTAKDRHLVFALPLVAAGQFTLRLTATDPGQDKTCTLELPLLVVDPFAAPSPKVAKAPTETPAAVAK